MIKPISTQTQPINYLTENNTFNNKLWRELLTNTCKKITTAEAKLEVISPFGFEILNDKRFLSGNLRRFYCYIGSRILNVDIHKIALQFKEELFSVLEREYPEFYKQIIIVIENDKLIKLKADGYTCKTSDRLIDIQVRKVNGDILTDYAHYIIATLNSLFYNTGECSNYLSNTIIRWRMYQLYMMQEKLLADVLVPLSHDESILERRMLKCISNMIQVFYSPHLIYSPVGEEELHIINQLIFPRVNLMIKTVAAKNAENAVSISAKAFHDSAILSLVLEKSLYQKMLDKIKTTYLDFI